MTYDTTKHEVTINVVDNGARANCYDGNNPTFTNTYKAAETKATIKATKVLEGKALEADKYEFELKEGEKVVATAKKRCRRYCDFRRYQVRSSRATTPHYHWKEGSEKVWHTTPPHKVTVAVVG